jgi:lysophospholipase L1-like esterase
MHNVATYFHGNRDFVKNGDYFQPVRFLREERAYYSSVKEMFTPRSWCCAGITLQFYTEEKEVSFSCKIENFIRKQDSISVYEDDVFSQSYFYTKEAPLTHFRYQRKGNGKGKIVIYFPSLSSLAIKDFSFEHKTPVPPHCKTLLCYGDSITQGIEPQNASASYTNQIARSLDYEVINLAVGGHYFDVNSLMNRITDNPDTILVAYGTNDFSHKRIEEIEEQIHLYFSKIKALYPQSTVYCLSPLWRFDIEPEKMDKMQRIRKAIAFEAQQNALNYVDGFELLPHEESLYTDRTLHPNDAGFTVMADKLIAIMSDK